MSRISAKLITLTLIYIVLFNYPILGIFTKGQLWFGIPVVFIYVFMLWFLFIIITRSIISVVDNSQNVGKKQ
ncbi:MAG: hypothetical protein HC817_16090 [Saprospiraceae bacterium]|nr:hypothetical protein [Saprospiraceae bacterium]